MIMKDCEYHKGKMYWLENDEREFKNLIKYTNSFIVNSIHYSSTINNYFKELNFGLFLSDVYLNHLRPYYYFKHLLTEHPKECKNMPLNFSSVNL